MPDDEQVEQAVRALNKVRRGWMRRPGVSAVDVGFPIHGDHMDEDTVALRAHVVVKKDPAELRDDEAFPDDVDGIPVDVIEVHYEPATSAGDDENDDENDDEDDDGHVKDPRHVARVSPIVGGVSVGNPRVAAGTLGAVVWDRTDGTPHILSNWHVLAGNDAVVTAGGCSPRASQPYYQGGGTSPEALASLQPYYQALASLQPYYQALASLQPYYQALASLQPYYQLLAALEPYYQSASDRQPFYQAAGLGEPIYQPARFDGGTAADTVAHLTRARLDTHMDAAVARLTGARPYSAHILGVGFVTAVTEPRLGMRVRKSGRSSGATRGRVDGLALSTTIEWAGERHYFTDQVHIVPDAPWPDPNEDYREVSEGGDSGAVWVEEGTNRAVGLHFAGDVGGVAENEHALANPIGRVLDALDVSFTPDPRVVEAAGPPPVEALRALLERGRGAGGSDLAGIVKALTGDRHESSAGGLSTEELEALRAVIDVLLRPPR